MSDKATTTTPDPELYLPKTTTDGLPVFGGENARGEVAGCPTGLATTEQPQHQGDASVTGSLKKKDAES